MIGGVWRRNLIELTVGMTALLSPAIEPRVGMLTIDSGAQISSSERWNDIGVVLKDYWRVILNLTH